MKNEKFKKCVGFWSILNKHIKSIACTIVVVAMLSVTLIGCQGEKAESKTGSSKEINSQTAENILEVFLEHDGKDFLNNVPEACKEAVVNNYNITEDELEETISTFAYALYGKAYSWDFSIEDKQYDVTAKEINSESAGVVALKELQNWGENREFSTENNLDSWAAKDQTLNKIDSISKIWNEIYNVNDICIVNYSYDLDYVENKSGTQGCDENQALSLTFVNYKKNWYCLEIIDIVVNGIETNANNDIARESWNKYFSSFD